VGKHRPLARANRQRPSPLTSITPWEPELITLDNVYYYFLPETGQILSGDRARQAAGARPEISAFPPTDGLRALTYDE
jgi:hypothetical protein